MTRRWKLPTIAALILIVAGGIVWRRMSVGSAKERDDSTAIKAVSAEHNDRFAVTLRMIVHTGFPEGAQPTIVTVKFPSATTDRQAFDPPVSPDPRLRLFDDHGEHYGQARIEPGDKDLSIEVGGWVCDARSYARVRSDAPSARPLASNPRWLIQDKWTGPYATQIRGIASGCNESDAEGVARWAFEVCRTKLRPENNNKDVDIRDALVSGTGDCSEISDLFVSICRAKGIASRTCVGVLFDPNTKEASLHQWAEVFDPRYGWVTVNPAFATSPAETYDRINDVLIAFAYERTDPLLYGYPYAGWYLLGGPEQDCNISCQVVSMERN